MTNWAMIGVGVLGVLAGCGEDPRDCVAGFELGEDGLCYQDDVADDDDGDDLVTFADFIDATAPCTSETTGDGSLDVYAGCIDEACLGDSWEAWTAAHGDADCEFEPATESAECSWFGFVVYFPDSDQDGEPDPGAEAVEVMVGELFRGATADGLTVGVELGCVTDAFGDPSFYVGSDFGYLSLGYTTPYISISSFDEVRVGFITVSGATTPPPLR
mgnify:CR=1 FL=1